MASSVLANPYRPFFMVGTFAAALGVSVWIAFGLGWTSQYPGLLHAQTMMGLFLNCFVSGFLMTAIPRMTGTSTARPQELRAQALGLSLVAAMTLSPSRPEAFFGAMLLSLGILLWFCGKRIARRKNELPEVFAFVLFGLGSGVAGSILSLIGQEAIGARLFYFNFILCLVLGIGMRLVPVLMRLPAKSSPRKAEVFFCASFITAMTVIEFYGIDKVAAALRALVATWIVLKRWRVLEKAGPGSGLSLGIRLATVFLLAGLWLLALYPQFRLEWIHLIYVGGFSLLTFFVASRVILAHGGHELRHEQGNWYLRIPALFFAIAALTRAAAPFIPNGYEHHLVFAALFFIAAVAIWGRFFVPRIFPD